MGLSVSLESSDGGCLAKVTDERNLLGKILPPGDGRAFPLLRFIDPYGDTVFNRLQMESLLLELERIGAPSLGQGERELLSKIAELARRGRAEPHLVLKFRGD